MDAFNKQMNEACVKYTGTLVVALVKVLSEAYSFDYTAGLALAQNATAGLGLVEGAKKRGRPESQGKKVVNKTALVEDVIQTLMGEETTSEAEEAVVVVAEPVVAEPAVAKKKPAVKKVKTPEPAEEGEGAAVVAKKKPAVKKVKTPEPAEEGEGAAAEPVVAKKKPAVKKVKTPEPAEEGDGAVAAVAEPVVAKKKPAVKKVKTPEESEGAVAAEPVVAKKKPAAKKAAVVAAVEPAAAVDQLGSLFEKMAVNKNVEVVVRSEAVLEPAVLKEEEEDDDEITGVEHVYNGVTYLLTSDNVLYDYETQEAVGSWTGTSIEPL